MTTGQELAIKLKPKDKRIGSPLKRSMLWVDFGLLAFVVSISLLTGFQAIQKTSYWSSTQVFQDFMNSPLRIIFPVVIGISAGLVTTQELSNRFIVNTRSRTDIRRRIINRFYSASLRSFIMFAIVAIINGVAAFVLAPLIRPEAVNPEGYGLRDLAEVANADIAIAPLSVFKQFGTIPFILISAFWIGINAAILAVITVVAAIVIRRPVLALLVPLVIYLAQSVIFQLFELPGASFLISMIYPSGLHNYDITQALLPSIVLGLIALALAGFLTVTSRTNSRLS